MGKRPSKDSYTSTLGKRVAVTPLTLMSAQSLHPEGQKVNAFFGEEDELESAPVVSTKVSDLASEWLNSPTNVNIYYQKDSFTAGEQLVAWKAGNLWRCEPFFDDVTVFIVSAEFNTQTTLSSIPVMVLARVKPTGINCAMFVNPFAVNVAQIAQIQSWWYEEIAWINLVQRKQTLHVPTFQWYMNYINDWFHRWHCVSGSHKDYMLLCSNGIWLQHLNELTVQILKSVTNKYPQNGSLAIGHGQVYKPHKHSWGKFKVPFWFNDYLDSLFRSASFDL